MARSRVVMSWVTWCRGLATTGLIRAFVIYSRRSTKTAIRCSIWQREQSARLALAEITFRTWGKMLIRSVCQRVRLFAAPTDWCIVSIERSFYESLKCSRLPASKTSWGCSRRTKLRFTAALEIVRRMLWVMLMLGYQSIRYSSSTQMVKSLKLSSLMIRRPTASWLRWQRRFSQNSSIGSKCKMLFLMIFLIH